MLKSSCVNPQNILLSSELSVFFASLLEECLGSSCHCAINIEHVFL